MSGYETKEEETPVDDGIDIKKLKDDPRVFTRGSTGVGTFGLYVEAERWLTTTRRSLIRLLIVEAEENERVFFQTVSGSATKAKWQSRRVSTYRSDIETLLDHVSYRKDWELRGDPILVQFQAADVESIRRNELPSVRFHAKAKYEALYGKSQPTRELLV